MKKIDRVRELIAKSQITADAYGRDPVVAKLLADLELLYEVVRELRDFGLAAENQVLSEDEARELEAEAADISHDAAEIEDVILSRLDEHLSSRGDHA